jgi:hypothetical protein
MKVHERYWGATPVGALVMTPVGALVTTPVGALATTPLVSNAGLDSRAPIPKTKEQLLEWINETKEIRKNEIQTLQLILQSTCETFHPNQILNHFQPEKRTYKKTAKKNKKKKDMDDLDMVELEIRPEKDIEKDLDSCRSHCEDSCRSHSCRNSRDDCEDSCQSHCEDLDECYEGDSSEASEESLDDIIEEDTDLL